MTATTSGKDDKYSTTDSKDGKPVKRTGVPFKDGSYANPHGGRILTNEGTVIFADIEERYRKPR